jgi:hypothetical protein
VADSKKIRSTSNQNTVVRTQPVMVQMPSAIILNKMNIASPLGKKRMLKIDIIGGVRFQTTNRVVSKLVEPHDGNADESRRAFVVV